MAELIDMPKLSDTMTVGTLVKWLKNEGDSVAVGDVVCEVETDKATMEVECFEDGVILKHYVPEGGEVPVGAPIAAVGEKGESAPEVDMPEAPQAAAEEKAPEPAPAKKEEKPAEPEAKEEAAKSAPSPAPSGDEDERLKASPLARKIAAEKGVSLGSIEGTGPGGRIVKADVLKAAEQGQSGGASSASKPSQPAAAPAVAAAPFGQETTTKVSNMRRAIATRLVESKTQIPHFYLETEVDAAALIKLRKQLNDELADLAPEQGGVKLTVNDFILKAATEALRRVPSVNASWEGDAIRQHGAVHMSFGVAVDDGLVTPVVRDAHAKSLRQISIEAKELIGKARSKKLKPDEMSGSTFTVTNLGMFGVTGFYGIINPPNAAILSIGATIKKPVVDANDNIVIGHRMSVGLSGDHRVVDGAAGAQFLQAFKAMLETPALMLV